MIPFLLFITFWAWVFCELDEAQRNPGYKPPVFVRAICPIVSWYGIFYLLWLMALTVVVTLKLMVMVMEIMP